MNTQITTEARASPRPLNPAMLAERWECSTTLVYDLLQSGRLEGFRLGKLWRIPAAAVAAYEAQQAGKQVATSNPISRSETLEASRKRQSKANAVAHLARMGAL